MPLRPTIPALALAALAVAVLPGHGEITSENHAVLKRALTENPDADKDANGSLSLEEYKVLQPTRQKQTKKEDSAPLLPVLPNGEVIVADFEDNNYRNRNGWKAIGTAWPGGSTKSSSPPVSNGRVNRTLHSPSACWDATVTCCSSSGCGWADPIPREILSTADAL